MPSLNSIKNSIQRLIKGTHQILLRTAYLATIMKMKLYCMLLSKENKFSYKERDELDDRRGESTINKKFRIRDISFIFKKKKQKQKQILVSRQCTSNLIYAHEAPAKL